MKVNIRPRFSKDQEREICRVSRHYISEGMKAIQKDMDALWLITIARELDADEDKLKAVYKALYEVREEYMEFFESDGYDGIVEIAAKHELMKIGIDIDEWHKDLIKTTFTKTETESLRDVKSRKETGAEPRVDG